MTFPNTIPQFNCTVSSGLFTSTTPPHSLDLNNQVAVVNVSGLSANIVPGGTYWVINPTSSSFYLASNYNGSSISAGSGSATIFHGSHPAVDPFSLGLYASVQPGALFIKETSSFTITHQLEQHVTLNCIVTGNTLTSTTTHNFTANNQTSLVSLVTTTGLVLRTMYWVINPTQYTFELSTTENGSTIVLTGVGSATVVGLETTGVFDTVPSWPDWIESQWPSKVSKVHVVPAYTD